VERHRPSLGVLDLTLSVAVVTVTILVALLGT